MITVRVNNEDEVDILRHLIYQDSGEAHEAHIGVNQIEWTADDGPYVTPTKAAAQFNLATQLGAFLAAYRQWMSLVANEERSTELGDETGFDVVAYGTGEFQVGCKRFTPAQCDTIVALVTKTLKAGKNAKLFKKAINGFSLSILRADKQFIADYDDTAKEGELYLFVDGDHLKLSLIPRMEKFRQSVIKKAQPATTKTRKK